MFGLCYIRAVSGGRPGRDLQDLQQPRPLLAGRPRQDAALQAAAVGASAESESVWYVPNTLCTRVLCPSVHVLATKQACVLVLFPSDRHINIKYQKRGVMLQLSVQ